LAYYSFLDSKEISFSNEIPKNRKLLEPYMDQAEVKQIVKISAGWYFVQQEEDFLYFYDTRFGQFGFDPDRSPFMWKYKLTPAGNNKVTVERVPPDLSEIGGVGTAFSDLWNRIRGN
jgi:inner membrane protein